MTMKSADGVTRMTRRLRVFVTVVSLITVMLLFPASAQAGKILHANAVPAGQVIDNDVFLTGQQPIIDGTVNGDVFIVGSDVTISGEVNGSVFVFAENLFLSGQISGNLYGATVELTQQENGQIERSLYALTLSLITDPESSIGRDLKTVALSARMQGQTERSTAAIIGPWELFKILRNVVNQNIIGFVPNQPSLAKGNSEEVSFRAVSSQRAMMRVARDKDAEPSALVDWLLTALKSFLNFLIVGGLMLWIFPRQFQGWAEKVQKEPLAAAGYGTVVLINGYLLPGLILFLLIGLLLGLIYISLSSLAWPVFWGGLGMLVTLFTLFQVAITFLSKAIVAYLVGTFILSKIASHIMQYRILPLLLGLLIYVPLAAIPYLGTFIGLVVTLLGLGTIWLSRKQVSQPAAAVVETAPA
jgi:hypothetical protein